MRIEDAAREKGVPIIWKAFLLGPIFRALGMANSPFVLQKEKGAYVWRDMERQCQKFGLRWRQPSSFPRVGVLPSRVALPAAEQPWIGAFCRHVMELNFVLDQEINQADRLAPIFTELGLSAGEILDQAQAEPTKKLLREQTEQARSRGIFGAPRSSSAPRCSGATIAWMMRFSSHPNGSLKAACLRRANRRYPCRFELRGVIAF